MIEGSIAQRPSACGGNFTPSTINRVRGPVWSRPRILTRVNIRGLDQTGPRTLLMVDGVKFPPQADGLCAIDPSIIPALALDRVDILADGASATYGSDAIAGVINVVLKRNFDGAVSLLHYQQPDRGGQEFQGSQLYGPTWDGGDVT